MHRIVVVDTETSGVSVRHGGRVIELGAVALKNGQVVAELSTLICAGVPISYGAFRVHGISAAMLAGEPTPDKVWPRFRAFVGSSPLVAHNAPFDSAFVQHELRLLGTPLYSRWHCTVRLARQKLPQLPNHRLETVYTYLFGELPSNVQRHRALDDARMAARVWLALQ